MLKCIINSYCSTSIYSDRLASWNIEGDIPDWLSVYVSSNPSNYVSIYSNSYPKTEAEYTFKIKATNSFGSDEKIFTVTVTKQPPPKIITSRDLTGTMGYNSWYFESDQNVTWSVEGSLPDGFYLDNYSYSRYTYIYGTPKTAGEYTFTLRVENGLGSSTKTFTIAVEAQPVQQPSSLPQIARTGNIQVHSASNAILLSNLPQNAKVEVFNLQGKRIHSTHSENSQILKIPVQTKGMYIIRIKQGSSTATYQNRIYLN